MGRFQWGSKISLLIEKIPNNGLLFSICPALVRKTGIPETCPMAFGSYAYVFFKKFQVMKHCAIEAEVDKGTGWAT